MSEIEGAAVWVDVGPIPRFSALARRLRTSARLSQGALAQSASLSPSTVRGWEAGRSEPSMPEFSRWSRALDLSEDLGSAVRAALAAPRAWADRPGIGLGPYLRERRLASGVTLSRAAVELGLPLATLGHYESGRVEVPPEVLDGVVARFELSNDERKALRGGTLDFLQWCDALVADPDSAKAAVEAAAYAALPRELLDRGPAFVRLRTGLLRARLRGHGWREVETLATSHHALWLAVRERRNEAASALDALPTDRTPLAAIARRHLGRARAEELQEFADAASDPALAAWLRAEAALDLSERRRGPEARVLVERALAEALALGAWTEEWMRRRDAVRVSLRLRDWNGAQDGLDAMSGLEPVGFEDSWYATQRQALKARLDAATAR